MDEPSGECTRELRVLVLRVRIHGPKHSRGLPNPKPAAGDGPLSKRDTEKIMSGGYHSSREAGVGRPFRQFRRV